jgi:hypothetical protein
MREEGDHTKIIGKPVFIETEATAANIVIGEQRRSDSRSDTGTDTRMDMRVRVTPSEITYQHLIISYK